MIQNKKNIIEGTVIECLPNMTFRVKLSDGREIFAYLSGRMKMNFIRVMTGDMVRVELNDYDDKKGRIVFRGK